MSDPDSTPRERVLAAASDIFARSGYDGARVEEIAERAGVNKAMIYYHVGDKSEIYATVLAQRADSLFRDLGDAIAKQRGPEEKLRAAIETVARAATTNPHFAPMMLREIASGGAGLPPSVLQKAFAVFAVFQRILDEGRREGTFRRIDPVSTHMTIAGVVMLLAAGAPLRARLRALDGVPPPFPPERGARELAAHVFDLVTHGLLRERDDVAPAPKRNS
ncbi:MAG TPA: TetR/AcrR family transcriptional regulator [Thermoanaerobaculia bacterium]